jgi:diamine N-acetyltransferase
VESISRLLAESFTAKFGPDNPPGVVEAYADASFSPIAVAGQLADPTARLLVAEIDRELTGVANLVEGPAPVELPGRRPLQLSRLYTRTGATGSGIGSLLMRRVLEMAAEQEYDVIWLGVWEHNAGAIAFYRRWRFEEVGTLVFRLGDDDQTDLLMCRPVMGVAETTLEGPVT